MGTTAVRVAAVLAFVIGAMAVGAGGSVLLGRDPGYYVIVWLPVYNFLVGVVSMAVISILIWRQHRLTVAAAATILGLHVAVLLVLLTVYRDVVAVDSLVAMSIRIAAWLVIGVLLLAHRRSKPLRQPAAYWGAG